MPMIAVRPAECFGKMGKGARIALASAAAKTRPGLRIALDAGAVAGEITVTLVQNFSAVKAQREFSAVVRYEKGKQQFDISWSEFKCKANPEEPCFPVFKES